jgi:hypothetical protein
MNLPPHDVLSGRSDHHGCPSRASQNAGKAAWSGIRSCSAGKQSWPTWLAGWARESKQNLLTAVVVQPREEVPLMVVPVPMRRDWDETEL